MTHPIGFMPQVPEKKEEIIPVAAAAAPKKSLVQIAFPGRGMALTYFNDQFDLHRGDMVYVTGKLEGILGRVTEVNYNFKIKPSDYEKVIAVIDRNVHGQLFVAGSHCVAFDPSVLPVSKIARWFLPPVQDEEYISGSDEEWFELDDLSGMKVTKAVADRGFDYYGENRVKYICVDGEKGYAIVAGGSNYEVEFTYEDGAISDLTCTCPCGYTCKHEVAAMLQLKETLELIEKHYQEQVDSGYFAAIAKGTLFSFAVDPMESGCIYL